MTDTYPIPDFLRHHPEQPAGPRERPILFSAPMVRAILAGTKTQTRRALKVQPLDVIPFEGDKAGIHWVGHMQNDPPRGVVFGCKFGKAGDRLWVREAHCFLDVRKSALSQFPLGPQNGNAVGPDVWNLDVEYSDGTEQEVSVEGNKPKQTRARGETRWRPSIHMPRWASRILLEITAVRVERLGQISEADASQEGVASVEEFIELWKSINGKWEPKQWTWVLQFRRA